MAHAIMYIFYLADIDDCVGQSCVHGSCVDGNDTYTCDCSEGYSGDRCDISKQI